MAWENSNRRSRLPRNWPSISRSVLVRDSWVCQIGYPGCLTEASEVDHRTRGDNHQPDNLQAACTACHRKKSSSEGGLASASARRYRDSQKYRPTERHPGQRT